MYKMIVIDIDDTLLNDQGEISNNTKEVIKKVVNKGVMVTLATGRMYCSTARFANDLGIKTAIVSYQGALIKDMQNGQVLYECSLEANDIKYIMDFCKEENLHVQYYSNDILYTQEDNDKIRNYSKIHDVEYTIEPNVEKLLRAPITKIVIYEDPEVINQVQDVLSAKLGERCYITKSKPFFLEILNKEVNKGNAVSFLCQIYGYKLDEVMAIGDGWNDYELLKVAGFSIAVKNAVPELLEIVDYVTDSNNEDGVMKALKKFILQND